MVYNKDMKKSDERTLSQFTKAKLKMDAKSFGEAIGMPRATLYHNWNNPKNHEKVKDMVREFYFNRYDDL
tara:strand:+ start:603 stop:812 length:210 start_codon:yes stop_codon:yes gene_type:complete